MDLVLSLGLAVCALGSGAVAVFGETLKEDANLSWYSRINGRGWLALGLLGAAFIVGSWKEIRNYDAQLTADGRQRGLQDKIGAQTVLLTAQNDLLKKREEKLNEQAKVIDRQTAMLEENQKFNMSDEDEITKEEPLLLDWRYQTGRIEILRSSCPLEMSLHYEKTTDYYEKYAAIFTPMEALKTILETTFPASIAISAIEDSFGADFIKTLRATFNSTAPLRSAEGVSSYGKGSVIDADMVAATLENIDEAQGIPLLFFDKLNIEIRPVIDENDEPCRVRYYCLQSEFSRSCKA